MRKYSEFDAQKYMTEQFQKQESLSQIIEDLQKYKDINTKKLEALIGEEYQKLYDGEQYFLKSDDQQEGFEEKLEISERKLGEIAEIVEGIEENLQKEILEIESTIKYKRNIQAVRKILVTHVSVERLINRIKNALDSSERVDTTDERQEDIKGLSRVSTDLNKLRYLMGRGESTPYMIEASGRVEEISARFFDKINKMFEQVVKKWAEIVDDNGNTNKAIKAGQDIQDEIEQIIWIYCITERTDFAEQIVSRILLRSRISKAMEIVGIKKGEIAVDPQRFEAMLDKIIEALKKYVEPLQRIVVERMSRAKIDFASNSGWVEFATQTEQNMPTLFIPGMPSKFQANYSLAERFAERFQKEICVESERAKMLVESEGYKKWWQKWHLSAYFAIKLKVVVDYYYTNISIVGDGNSVYHVIECLNRCWDMSGLLKPLLHKYIKLTLQIITHYVKDCRGVLNAQKIKDEVEQLSVFDSGSETSVSKLAGTLSATTLKSSNSTAQAKSRASKMSKNTPIGNVITDDVMKILSQLCLLREYFNRFFKDRIEKAVVENYSDSVDEGRGERAQIICQDIISHVDGLIDKEFEQCVEILHKLTCLRLITNFLVIRQIPSQYRYTNRKAPTSYSSYIDTLFAPVGLLLEQPAFYLMNSDSHNESKYKPSVYAEGCGHENQNESLKIPLGVGIRVLQEAIVLFSRYCWNMVVELLQSIDKANASLQRLRGSTASQKSQVTASFRNGDANNSDDHKIKTQIKLDVEQICKVLENGWELEFLSDRRIGDNAVEFEEFSDINVSIKPKREDVSTGSGSGSGGECDGGVAYMYIARISFKHEKVTRLLDIEKIF